MPTRAASALLRWKNLLLALGIYQVSRRLPQAMRRFLRRQTARRLPPGFDVDTHFNPRYAPWDQRMCIIPDADLFKAISSGRVDVVTDRIARFTERGIALESGAELEADLIVTATGLQMEPLGAIALTVDGREVALGEEVAYRGMQISNIPNLAFAFGYTNQSWTLGSDLTARQVCRLLDYMDRNGYAVCTPRRAPDAGPGVPFADLTAGYVLRDIGRFPRQDTEEPWLRQQNYVRNAASMRRARFEDGALEFTRAAPVRVSASV
jgi:monooxygenase